MVADYNMFYVDPTFILRADCIKEDMTSLFKSYYIKKIFSQFNV
jgi:hypothetical protein